jgi:hypothetical protein
VTTNRTLHVLVTFLIIIVALIGSAVSFLLPVASTVDNPDASHWRLAISLVFVILFVGAAVWFMSGLKSFKTPLRVAYRWLGVGLICVALATLQIPIIALRDLWDSAWATGGGVVLVFMAGAVFMYFGALRVGNALREDGFAAKPVAVTAVTIGVTLASYILAGRLLQYEADGVDVYIAAIGWCVSYVMFAGALTWRTAHDVGQVYQRSLKALAIAFFVFGLSGMIEMVGTLLVGNEHPYQAYGISFLPFALAGLFFVWASAEFNQLTVAPTVANASVEQEIISIADKDYIESIASVASLASRPEAVESLTDDLRAITASLAPGVSLTDVQKKKLVDTYFRLEAYLIQNDPLRTYTKEEVREQVSAGFSAVLNRNMHHPA